MPWAQDRRLHCIFALLLSVFAVAACAGAPAATLHRPLGPGERWLPVANWDAGWGQVQLCAGAGFVQDVRLHGTPDDPRLVWMTEPGGIRTELGWPVGYSARFTPTLELLGAFGTVIAHENSRITEGCRTAEASVMAIDFVARAP